MSAWGVSASARAERSAPSLFDHLQEQGLADPTPGEEAMLALKKAFKLSGDKESKKSAKVESFSGFVEFMRKAKVLTREAYETDPESFWHMHWHSQSVQHIYCEWGWETASEYHRKLMGAWQEGFLDLPSMVDMEECRRGDVEGALHQRFFGLALQTTGAKRKGAKAAAGKTGEGKNCTYCKSNGEYAKGHTVGECRKKGTTEGKGKKN